MFTVDILIRYHEGALDEVGRDRDKLEHWCVLGRDHALAILRARFPDRVTADSVLTNRLLEKCVADLAWAFLLEAKTSSTNEGGDAVRGLAERAEKRLIAVASDVLVPNTVNPESSATRLSTVGVVGDRPLVARRYFGGR